MSTTMFERLRAALYDALAQGDDLSDTLETFLRDKRTREVIGEAFHEQAGTHDRPYDAAIDEPCQGKAAAALRVILGLEAYPPGVPGPAAPLVAQTHALAEASSSA